MFLKSHPVSTRLLETPLFFLLAARSSLRKDDFHSRHKTSFDFTNNTSIKMKIYPDISKTFKTDLLFTERSYG